MRYHVVLSIAMTSAHYIIHVNIIAVNIAKTDTVMMSSAELFSTQLTAKIRVCTGQVKGTVRHFVQR